MTRDTPALTRALELAASGDFISVNHIRQALRREGYGTLAQDLAGAATNRAIVDQLHQAAAERTRRDGGPTGS
ncbi:MULTISPECIES: hypothetical protein [unclassified Sphingomonas]|uniref:hypothetical protein n=1 Tax=unclassified Sphingomonas TaxID=196159 RepID=UPI0006F8278C|nr:MULTISPECIES: hypothetical protein [unclassified Sphingomonas]KQN06868.1 hypothetical protein ASE78_14645 [Sphingomonas sp. Leaf25]KQN37079.1 hypothetical protein ASE97_11270 [Sphingomonas sp. Leaf42]KQT30506.1 hypothetical protein ASG37_05355 [Sphingomonas sp. Leaf407]